ncbi:MAG TPA: hypothetical protein VK699_19025, partial [Terriglobales bacterium]|nr:hypothetical protein [Terriglobales bacterium]
QIAPESKRALAQAAFPLGNKPPYFGNLFAAALLLLHWQNVIAGAQLNFSTLNHIPSMPLAMFMLLVVNENELITHHVPNAVENAIGPFFINPKSLDRPVLQTLSSPLGRAGSPGIRQQAGTRMNVKPLYPWRPIPRCMTGLYPALLIFKAMLLHHPVQMLKNVASGDFANIKAPAQLAIHLVPRPPKAFSQKPFHRIQNICESFGRNILAATGRRNTFWLIFVVATGDVGQTLSPLPAGIA